MSYKLPGQSVSCPSYPYPPIDSFGKREADDQDTQLQLDEEEAFVDLIVEHQSNPAHRARIFQLLQTQFPSRPEGYFRAMAHTQKARLRAGVAARKRNSSPEDITTSDNLPSNVHPIVSRSGQRVSPKRSRACPTAIVEVVIPPLPRRSSTQEAMHDYTLATKTDPSVFGSTLLNEGHGYSRRDGHEVSISQKFLTSTRRARLPGGRQPRAVQNVKATAVSRSSGTAREPRHVTPDRGSSAEIDLMLGGETESPVVRHKGRNRPGGHKTKST